MRKVFLLTMALLILCSVSVLASTNITDANSIFGANISSGGTLINFTTPDASLKLYARNHTNFGSNNGESIELHGLLGSSKPYIGWYGYDDLLGTDTPVGWIGCHWNLTNGNIHKHCSWETLDNQTGSPTINTKFEISYGSNNTAANGGSHAQFSSLNQVIFSGVDILLSGASADLLGTAPVDIYPGNQVTIGLRVDNNSQSLALTAVGTSNVELTDALHSTQDIITTANLAGANLNVTGNASLGQLSVVGSVSNMSGVVISYPRVAGSNYGLIQTEGGDLKFNSTGANAKVIIGTDGMDFTYTNTSRFAVPRINGQITCNATSEGALYWNVQAQAYQGCDGGGGNIVGFGVTYGSSVSDTKPSLLDGGVRGLTLTNTNASAETSFVLQGAGNANTALQVYVQGVNDTLLEGPFSQHADSTLMIFDGARQNRIATSYGQNLTFNIGDGLGNFASADQFFMGSDRFQISPNVLLTLQTNTTSVACDATNKGAIIFTGAKHYGCDGVNWNALY